MIIEHRTYTIKPGAMHGFLKAYESEGLAIQSAALGNLLGYFVAEVGELNTVVQLWGFKSFEDRQARRAQLSADPAWRDYLGKVVSMVIAQRNELMVPATFSPIK
jgi:hypothetical protein